MFRRAAAVVLSLCLCVGLLPQRTDASFVAGTGALAVGTAATQVFFTSTGVGLSVIEGGAAAGVAAVETAAASYAAATGAATSGSALLASIGSAVTVSGGTIIIAAAGAVLLAGFAAWCAAQYNDGTTEPVTVIDNTVFTLSDGSTIIVTPGSVSSRGNNDTTLYGELGTPINYPDKIEFAGGAYIDWSYRSDYSIPYTAIMYMPNGSLYGEMGMGSLTTYYLFGSGTQYAIGFRQPSGKWYTYSTTYFSNYVLPFQSPEEFNVSLRGAGFTPAPEVGDGQVLSIAVPGLAPDATVETMPQYIADAVGDNTLIANPPTVITDPSAIPDWNPVPDPLPDSPATPEDPGTDSPFLPGDLPVPWDYVVRMVRNAAQFVALAMVAFREAIPSTLQDGVWASVVLAVLFGMYRRFLS